MAPPDDTVWELDGHTKAKHALVRKYLNAWLPIMASWQPRLVIIDGFAGPGVYVGGEPGSPIIMLQALLDHSAFDRMKQTEFVFVFIEERADRADRLHAEVAKLGNLPENVVVQIFQEKYQDCFEGLLDGLGEHELAPTFAFVDPFGYKDAPMTLTGRFLNFKSCEVLAYCPLPFISRFVGAETRPEAAFDAFFGCQDWREAAGLHGDERDDFLHDLFLRQLETCGLDYVRSFEIISADGNGYHLFFGTKKLLGLERMKEAMWEVDPVGGQRYRDSTDPDSLVLFEADPDLAPLKTALRERFGTEPFSIEDALTFTIEQTPYVRKHVKRKTLKPLELDGKLEVVRAPERRRRGDYPDGTVVRFTE